MEQTGRKDDTGKLRFDLIPPYALERLAEVYTIGAKKYDDRNWEKGISFGRLFAAMMRHAWRWWAGESLDPEDGQHSLASVAWCAFALMHFESQGRTDLDNRPLGRLTSSEGTVVQCDIPKPRVKGRVMCEKCGLWHNTYETHICMPQAVKR